MAAATVLALAVAVVGGAGGASATTVINVLIPNIICGHGACDGCRVLIGSGSGMRRRWNMPYLIIRICIN